MNLIHEPENRKFILPFGTQEAFVLYHIKDGYMSLTHSEVPESLQGQGIGKQLVELVFQYIKENEIKATAVCSYIHAIKSRDPEWNQLIG